MVHTLFIRYVKTLYIGTINFFFFKIQNKFLLYYGIIIIFIYIVTAHKRVPFGKNHFYKPQIFDVIILKFTIPFIIVNHEKFTFLIIQSNKFDSENNF